MRTVKFFLAGLLLSWAAWPAAAGPVQEYDLKSAFIYNFATFTNWPESSSSTLNVCIAAPERVFGHFVQLTGKKVGNLTMSVRSIKRGTVLQDCQILFVSDEESSAFNAWLPELVGKSTLTISESERWVSKGVMIGLLLEGRNIVFDVNLTAAQASGVEISSRLLRLAHRVYRAEQ